MKILVTFPGDIGDLLYSLPAVIELKKELNCEIDYQTSKYCKDLIPLLEYQEYINKAFIDESYVTQNRDFGCQPCTMAEPKGYDKIFHLGFDKYIIGGKLLKRHLIENFFDTLKMKYNINNLFFKKDEQYIYYWKYKLPLGDYIIFHGHGTSTFRHLLKDMGKMIIFFKELLDQFKTKIIIVGKKSEKDFYSVFNKELIHCVDFSQTAYLITNSKGFIGIPSSCYVVADGLKVPRAIPDFFSWTLPTGNNHITFKLEDNPIKTAQRIKELFNCE